MNQAQPQARREGPGNRFQLSGRGAGSASSVRLGGWMLLAGCLAMACPPGQAAVELASGGATRCVIVTQPGATPAERYAAEELAAALKQITGATFVTQELTAEPPELAIVIGPGPIAASEFPEVNLGQFGIEEYAIHTTGKRLLLAGGRPRGTLYAVYRFLQDQLGVRWYTPWFTQFPARAAPARAS